MNTVQEDYAVVNIEKLFEKTTWGSVIDGDEIRVGEMQSLVSPTTGKAWKELYVVDGDRVQQAIMSAHEAFRVWRLVPPPTRAEMLRRVANLMLQYKEQLALVMTMEMGKTLKEGRAEVDYTAGYFQWFAGEAERIYGITVPLASPTKRGMLVKEPIGVCALISPWNFPLAMPGRKLAAALAAGCTAIVKPSPLTPISGLLLGHLCLHAGVPAGVVNVLYGDDNLIGSALTSSALVRKLSFTGSIGVGKKLYAQCAQTLKKMTLELGGHAPLIVCQDANLEKSIDAALAGKMRNAGQACISPNRLLVDRKVHDQFLKGLVQKTLRLKVGDPLDPATELSSILHAASIEKVERHVQDAVAKGAILHTAGQEAFYPKILDQVTPQMQVFHEETFGPVAAVIPFDTLPEVISLANDTEYGLAAYVFSEGLVLSHCLAEALHFGIVGVNDALPSCPQASFGGVKSSGFGREGGPSAIDEYLVEKYVSMSF